MAHLVVLVLNNLDQGPAVLDAWEEAGAKGVTILESTGLQRLRRALQEDLPLFPSLRDLEASQELHHRTFFTVVSDEAAVERIVAATQGVTGDLNEHHSGLLFTLPVGGVWGLERRDE